MTERLKVVRVLLVGSGFVAGEHAKALGQTAGVEVVGVVDVDPSRAATMARTLGGINHGTDLDHALAEWDVDAAVVCTPNGTHLEVARRLAAAGIHALIEKPLATTVADAAAIADVFEGKGLVLSAAHTHRFSDYGRAVKQAAVDGSIGTPIHVRVTILGGWQWTDWRNWQIDPAKSGGHAVHNGVHLLDLATWWIADEPVEVHALGWRSSAALDIHDYLLITVRFAGGQTAVCEMSRANHPRDLMYREVLLQGDAGSAHLAWDGETPLVLTGSGVGRVAGASSFVAQDASWIEAVRTGRSPQVTGRDGALAVRLGVAAEQSLASGASVRLAELSQEGSHV